MDYRSVVPSQPVASPAGDRKTIDISDLAEAIVMAGRKNTSRMPIELPSFSGCHQDWLLFNATFRETQQSYSKIENLARLRRSLVGKAREAVTHMLICNADIEDILKTLEARFGRPDTIAIEEIERLRSLHRPADNPRELCIFVSKIVNAVAVFQALKKPKYLSNPELTRQIIEKLPNDVKRRWYQFEKTEDPDAPDLPLLARFLQEIANDCSSYAAPEPKIREVAPTSTYRRPARAFASNAVPEDRRARIEKPAAPHNSSCSVCQKGSHPATACYKFKEADVPSRWDIAKSQRLCFRCLNYRNRDHDCKIRRCEIDGCGRTHHRMLHFRRTNEERIDEAKPEIVTTAWTPRRTKSYLKILPVTVSGPSGSVKTYALLDDGSTVTLIDEEIAKKTGTRGKKKPLRIEAIGSNVSASSSQEVSLTVKGATTHQIRAHTIRGLQLSPQHLTSEDITDCEHLAGLEKIIVYSGEAPKLLIGQDNWHLLIAEEVRTGRRSQPIASRTPLGWVLHGAHTRSLGQRIHHVHHLSTVDENMDEDLKRHFAIESLTIEPKRPNSDPEQRAIKILENSTVTREDGRYETALLWKNEKIELPNNYDNAFNRLLTTEKKIDRNPELKIKYEQQMQALIEKGYAEKIDVAENSENRRIWYLPHFPVVNPMKPGKIRIVHDAKAKARGTSLNDNLLTGPDLLQSLPGVLMRFRQHPVAVTADIAEMFMQVKIRREDRDALRYLWRGSQRGNHPPDVYRMTSLIFGATSSPATAIFVKNVNAEKYRETHPEACNAIIRNHYVDDYLQSFTTAEEAIRVASDVKNIQQKACYTLRQWTSNKREVIEAIDPSSSSQKPRELRDEEKIERVLGLIWKPDTDELAFNLDLARLPPTIVENSQPTKREALKLIMSLFDPLGFASPVLIRAKQILQEIWRRGTDWDEKVEEDLAQQWTEWMGHLRKLADIAIPRCYLRYSDASLIELHTFVDASESSYAASLYWRITTPDGKIFTSIVLAKARVSPLKLTSIPRLELQAAVMGSRMAAAVVEEHDRKPASRTFWTDSKTVLQWLKNGARAYRPFVAHRIANIEENCNVSEWRWVPTKVNVADDATRDVPQNFDSQHRWFYGPEFLREDPSTWPQEKPTTQESTGEEKVNIIANRKTTSLQEALPDPERFSKWEKLLRATARVLQFIEIARAKCGRVNYKRNVKNREIDPAWNRKTKKNKIENRRIASQIVNRKFIEIEADLLRKSENYLVRLSQEKSFDNEIEDLKNNRTIDNRSRLRPLAVCFVDGIVTLKTRIGSAREVSECVKSPPILCGDDKIARLYIEYTHRQLHHSGVEPTINECRQHFWILRLRPTTKFVIHRCGLCHRRRMKPSSPPTGDHPSCRLAHHQRPFTFVGVDYFGALMVTVGRSQQKRYVALFTCLTTRAVHLEIASSLTADAAVMALRRLIARRGCPTEIWSDNATNFKAADREVQDTFREAMTSEANRKMIQWRYIPPAAPFMGGAWERLVRSVKTALQTVMTERSPTEEVLHTLLAEVEYTVNSRPLTHVSIDPADPEAITPNHFLLGGSGRVPLVTKIEDADLHGRAHWRASQRLADLFWARWLKEYLPELQHRREPHGRGPPLQIDDIVLVADSTLPRNTWPKGRVIATYPGQDGVVRSADILTKVGVMRRPTKKLVILVAAEEAVPAKQFCADRQSTHGGSVRDGL